jgi:subtilase family serine protease
VLSVTAVAALLTGLATPALAASTPAAGPLAPSINYLRNVLPGLAKATDLGPAAGDTPMRAVVSLARPDPSGEQRLLDAEHDPSGPQFNKFLSTDEFADRFGVPADRFTAATDWLRAGGLRVTSVSSARDQIGVAGTVASVSRLFATPIHAFDSRDGHFLANTAAPRTPANLRVSNIVGLNTLQRMHSPSLPLQSTCLARTCVGGTTPADLWSVYEQPAAFTGRGQRVAIFGAGATDGVISDLRQFSDRFDLGQVPVRVHHPGGDTDFRDDSGHVEWNIDTQAAHGMAPGLEGLDLYFGEDLTDADVAKVFSAYTDDQDSPRQASASYGECESIPRVSPIAGNPLFNLVTAPPVALGLGNNLDATLTAITRQAALQGKTIFSSTGDTGSSCPLVALPVIGAGNGVLNQGVPLTNSPADLAYVVGVGGTVLYTDGAGHRTREYGWAFGGGGSSQFIPAPSYQRGTPGLTLHCLTDTATLCRGIPDVAAQSGDVTGNGYHIVSRGRPNQGAGTSLSSPLWAGMWARVQSASSRPGGLGFADYPIYRVGKNPATNPRDFHDISSTDTRTALPSTNGLYPALPGWDYQTGWGTPRVAGLICDLTRHC